MKTNKTHTTGSHISVGTWIERWAERSPDKIAIIDEDAVFTYKEFSDRINALSGLFIRKGLKPGDRVGILSYNCIEFLEVYFATSRTGLILVPLNYRLTSRELDHLIEDSEIELFFFHEDLKDSFAGMKSDIKRRPVSIGRNRIGWADPYETCLDEGSGYPSLREHISPEEPHILMYTSGSTGIPKGALLSQRKTFFNTLNADIYYGLKSSDTMIITRPMFHSGGLLVQATPIFYKGATAIIHRKVRPRRILDTTQKYRVRILETSSTVYNMMINEELIDGFDLSSLEVLFTGGERVQIKLLKEFHRRGLPLSQIFGQTETSTITYLSTHEAMRKAGSVGKPVFFSNVKIVNGEGTDVEVNEPGEIIVSGPILMNGYWRMPEETSKTIRDGWLYTGDIGYMDDEGFIYIVDRVKNMFISGGENVYPAEIEKVLLENPKVQDVAVYGVPDDRWGEVGKADIVLKKGAKMEENEIKEFLDGRIARYKIPKYVEFVPGLPKTAAGKIMRHKLKGRD